MHTRNDYINDVVRGGVKDPTNKLRSLHEMLEDRKEIDMRACEEINRDPREVIDAECAECGRMYYSEYLMTSKGLVTEQEDGSGEYCIPCHLDSRA